LRILAKNEARGNIMKPVEMIFIGENSCKKAAVIMNQKELINGSF